MKMSRIGSVFLVMCLVIPTAFSRTTPTGYWKTIDDHTGHARSIIQIYTAKKCHRGDCFTSLRGKIVKILEYDRDNPEGLCLTCKGKEKNRSLIGMTILRSAIKKGKKWRGGRIFDPESGHTYRCTLRLIENGRKLEVHGYIGLPIFGRTQIWLRQRRF